MSTRLLLLPLLMFCLSGCQVLAGLFGGAADLEDDREILFEVAQGMTAGSLAQPLEDAGIIDDAGNFKVFVRITGEGGCLKAGRFPLRRDMDAHNLLRTMCGVPLADDTPFTVLEGWRILEIDEALAAEGWTELGDYMRLARDPSQFTAPFPLPGDTLEGYLFPETYMVMADRWDTKAFIQRQLNTFTTKFYVPHQPAIEDGSRTLEELVIMASMIEREEPSPQNRPLVAGILWKRLDHQWNLGVDATSRYTLMRWNDRRAFLKQLRDKNDPYNTRLRGGLPPGPIGNPGIRSLESTLNPEKSDYWYYLHDSNRVLHPAKDQRGHEANRRRFNVY
jgi:UPF0755 protein